MIVTRKQCELFVALVNLFPVLGGRHNLAPAPGVSTEQVDLAILDLWASCHAETFTEKRGPFPGDGARHAARFVLAVFDDRRAWASGRFELFAAFAAWDDEQIEAFRHWTRHPFRPVV